MSIEEIENTFLAGDIGRLRQYKCPNCEGKLSYSMYKSEHLLDGIPGRRIKSGTNIYCQGNCGIILSHLDGYCPVWAEAIEDWDRFSHDLYED